MISKSAAVASHPVGGISELTTKLPATYQPIVTPLVAQQAKLFGIPESSIRTSERFSNSRGRYVIDDGTIDAEVYTFGSVLIVIQMLENVRRRQRRNEDGGGITVTEEKDLGIRVTYGMPSVEDPDLGEFENLIKKLWGVDLKEAPQPSRRIREIAQGSPNGTKPPTPQELNAANILSDKSTRMLAIAIKSSSGLLLGDAAKQIPPKERGRIDEIVQLLIDNEIVETEVVVICSKTSAQVSRISSADSLAELDRIGIRCACGRPLSTEKQEKALSVTGFGRSVLDSSTWLSILVLQQLIDFGIPITHIRMEQEYSGEEVDCMAEIYGRLVLFELKDKEFNLGNAYSFGAKVGIFQPELPVIVTTEKVGNDAREHFVRSAMSTRRNRYSAIGESVNPGEMKFIEGLGQLRGGIEDVITEIAISTFSPILQSALSIGNANPASILSSWAGVK
ncbi:hypothetical protein [Kitasatospora sp. NPDC058046]|uniref:hypothetical protein n=1 Tax=Kitasatospora sp. NPDC058046 TaxID=3346312 RepID=UPI0036DA6430